MKRISTLWLLIAAALVCLAAPSSYAQQSLEGLHPEARYTVIPMTGVSSDELRESLKVAVPTTIPMFTYNINSPVDGNNYSGLIVGRSPFFHGARTTAVPTTIIPVRVSFTGGFVFDPTAPDPNCLNSNTAVSEVEGSPMLSSPTSAFTMNGVNVGATQYNDAFMRAEFWSQLSPTGNRYHTTINPTVVSAIHFTVPNASGAVFSGGGCGDLGIMDINAFDSFARKELKALRVRPTTVPLFLFYNVVMSEGPPQPGLGNCCILGYHSGTGTTKALQTYGVVDFDSSQDFNGTSDISVMSHEVGELWNDPTTNNPAPAWGHIGQVGGCQNNLEVGDPLSGTLFPAVTMPNGITYNPQELAFFSWFFRQTPSDGSGGKYSDNGTFTSGQSTVCQ